MKRIFLTLTLLFSAVPAFANDDALTRREGFLQIWESILRPAEETREIPYSDVPEGSAGYLEITYAKRRGLLADTDTFSPDQKLTRLDAALMLFRVWNVADVDEISAETIDPLLKRYPIFSAAEIQSSASISRTQLAEIQAKFKTMLDTEEHEVSLYSEKFHGKGTAFGETFDMHAMTAAHPRFPHNTLVKVTNIENGKTVTVRVNDRGPFVVGRDMDLSLGAFTTIAERSKGIIQVTLERLGDSSIVFDSSSSIVAPPKETPACEIKMVYRRRLLLRGVTLTPGLPVSVAPGQSFTFSANKSIVVRSIRGPEGVLDRNEQWLSKGENFSFTPDLEGDYRFKIGLPNGKSREMTVKAQNCNS